METKLKELKEAKELFEQQIHDINEKIEQLEANITGLNKQKDRATKMLEKMDDMIKWAK